MSTNNGLYLLLFTLVITTIIIIFRLKKAIQGTKVDVKKTIIFSVYFVAISSFLVYNSFLVGGVPVVYAVPYFAVLVAAAYCSYIYSKRTLSFSKLPSYDGNSVIYVKYSQKAKLLGLLFLTLSLIVTLSLSAHSGLANAQNKTLMQPTGIKSMATNATSIILVHGGWGDGSSWTQEIPILEKAGHRVIAVQLPLHSLADDVATVKRAIDFIGGPVVLVGHSYGGMVITNAGYNNPNVKGLVYVAAFGPNEGQSLGSFVSPSKFPKDFLMPDKAGLAYINPKLFHDWFAQDVSPARADVMAVVQKPFNLSIFAENSGPPAWKQLPTWYQVSENDRMIPPAVEHMFAKQMNATTISLPASHASLESHPNEIAQLILNATKGIK